MPEPRATGVPGINNPQTPWLTLTIGWLLMVIAAAGYAYLKHIPAALALPVALAFAVELPFYVMAGDPPAWLKNPAILTATCLAPYLLYSLPSGVFQLPALVLLTLIAVLLSYWYKVLPRHTVLDILYVVLLATILLSKVFDRIYLSAIPKVPLSTLGHLMLIRTAAIAVIGMRGGITARYAFIPNRDEWLTGFRWFGLMLPAILPALWLTGLWAPRDNPKLALALPQFFGILWVVALSEEFFFRGMLQDWLEGWTRNRIVGLLVTSLIFGSLHLWFHEAFPNWRFAIVATIFGLFCGLAWREKKSVPASMVTHALGATLYRVFFQ
ncbi:MAG TPA: CPBP family intramembrane glutamic endopeptidase [Bryobacteraceae bacterium]|nr:CPBP family intramembrane glutamic endopeptidase [Bryobacteraceae bacterium]